MQSCLGHVLVSSAQDRRDGMRLFSVDLCCPVEALLRRSRVPTCPNAARGCRFAFSFAVAKERVRYGSSAWASQRFVAGS